jgi:hypothetical protein
VSGNCQKVVEEVGRDKVQQLQLWTAELSCVELHSKGLVHDGGARPIFILNPGRPPMFPIFLSLNRLACCM